MSARWPISCARAAPTGAPFLWIIGGFAVLTLALGAFGLTSVMSYVISARRQELTVRLALGACRARW